MKGKEYRLINLVILAVVFFPCFVFGGEPLTLEASIEMALQNSIVINIAREGSKGATAQKREAVTGFLPKFSTSYSYRRLNEEPQFQLPFPPGEMTTGTKNNYNWAIEARQPIFAGGSILANYQANQIGEDAAFLEEKAKNQDVVQEVKIAYFDILRAQRILETARQSVEMLEGQRDTAG